MNTGNPENQGNPSSEVVIKIQVYAGDAKPVSEHEIRPVTQVTDKPAPLVFPSPEPVKPVVIPKKVSPAWRSFPSEVTSPSDDTSIAEISKDNSNLNGSSGRRTVKSGRFTSYRWPRPWAREG